MTVPFDADRVVTAVAAYGLRGSRTTLPAGPLDQQSWETTMERVRSERLAGHLVDAIEEGAFPVTSSQRQAATELHVEGLCQVLLLDRRLLHTVGALEAAGIDARVLKGTAVAHTAYRDPSLRLFGDIDLLVRSEQFEPAAEVLDGLGAHRTMPMLRRGFDRRFGKGAGFAYADRLEVDLHRTLVPGYFGLLIELNPLFDHVATFRLGGRELITLGAEERFLHACYHAVLGHRRRLVAFRDVAQFLLEVPIDAQRALRLARRWSGEAVVARAVQSTWQTLDLADVVPLSVWAARYQPTRQELRALRGYQGSDRSEAARALVAVQAIDGLAAKAAFVRSLLLPDRSYLEWAGHARLSWLRRGRRAVRRAEAP